MNNSLVVQKRGAAAFAIIDGQEYRCSIGKNGLTQNKVEGDNCTPLGMFPLRRVFYRPDRITSEDLRTGLPVQAMTPHDGWCDDATAQEYNRLVDLRVFNKTISHEKLWRYTDVYDLIIVVGYNDAPIIPDKGSAIFIHIARANYSGTAGCIAFAKLDLLEILTKLDASSMIVL